MNIIKSVEDIACCKNQQPVFIDVRTRDDAHTAGKMAYLDGHIPGAIYLDLKEDLTGVTSFLPDENILAEKLSKAGIHQDMMLIIYDQGNQRAASKAWYVLHYLGHESIYILQGGFPAWKKAGQPITTEVPVYEKSAYFVQRRSEAAVTINDLKQKLHQHDTVLIDSRAPERYRGDVEPKYNKAGHIPGAKNYHAKAVFDSVGKWKTERELCEHFYGLNKNEEIIVSCGTGNSACMNIVALREAGFSNVTLYSGGFSEWIEDDANKVVKGDRDTGYEK